MTRWNDIRYLTRLIIIYGKNVLIIDSDLRRPRQNKIFEVKMFPGLSNYLSSIQHGGEEREIEIKDCIQATEIENLFIMPAGSIPPNPSELLSSKKMADLINGLKEIFDIIVVDGAPCIVVTDATIISRLVDSTIIVVAEKQTKMDDLIDAKKRIENVGGHIIGVVLNKVREAKKHYYNKYYYYSSEDNKGKPISSLGRKDDQDDDKNGKNRGKKRDIDIPEKKTKTEINRQAKTKNSSDTDKLIEEIKNY